MWKRTRSRPKPRTTPRPPRRRSGATRRPRPPSDRKPREGALRGPFVLQERPMSMKDEFKAFVTKGNVVDLAIAVVIGAAFGKIVSAFVSGIIMPLVSYVMPGGDWQTWALGKFQIGSVLGATVDFL